MATPVYYVHGLSAPSAARRGRIARSLHDDLVTLGTSAPDVRIWEWRSGDPVGAGALGGLGAGALARALTLPWRGTLGFVAAGSGLGLAASYGRARAEIPSAGERFARELEEAGRIHGRAHVVAHSLGTEVTLAALDCLVSRGRTLPGTVVLLAGTARAEDCCCRPVAAAEGGVVNVYNPLDLSLLVERFVRWDRAIGTCAVACGPVRNIRTLHGHAAQTYELAPILRGTPSLRPRFSCYGA